MSTMKPIDPKALDCYADWDTPEDPAITAQRQADRIQQVEQAVAEDAQQGRVATRAMLELDRQRLKGWVGPVESYRNMRRILANSPPPNHTQPPITMEEQYERAKNSHAAIVNVGLSGFTISDENHVDFILHDVGDLTHDEFMARCTKPI